MRIAQHDALWVPAERLTCVRAIYPEAPLEPELRAPKGYTDAWAEDDALVDVVRARLSGFGPLPIACDCACAPRCPHRRSRRR